jgi:ATP-binding cassette, subfamily F, member 3
MSVLSLSKVSFHYYSGDPLLEDVSVAINPGDRIAVVGPNGAGKSTLLRLLGGEIEPTAGSLERRRQLTIAAAEQRLNASAACTLFDFVFGIRPRLSELRERLRLIEEDPEDGAAYAQLVCDYSEAGGYEAEAETARTLAGLGFRASEMHPSLDRLSGGQRTRASLGRALAAPADLLLLDEPTNHLDLEAREWLEQQLAKRQGACVLASHDRALLRAFAGRVIELERGRARVFEGGYDEYRARRSMIERQAWAEYYSFERRKAAYEKAAERRARLAARVAAAPEGERHGNDYYARKAAKVGRTARLLRNRISLEGEVEKPWEESSIHGLTFEDAPPGPPLPLVAFDLSKSFVGRVLFSGLDVHLRRGGRLAITGRNGCGKTTLLRILAGIERADSGEVRLGAHVRAGFFAQDADGLPAAQSALEICGTDTRARTVLGCLRLPPDRLNSPMEQLSGGERIKVALARLLLCGANLLLLDEPTNHLEVEAQEAFEEALTRYPGAVAVVSHDRAFLEALGPGLEVLRLDAGCERAQQPL